MAADPTLRFLEDIETGETLVAGPLEVTREAIIAFAQIYDPQPFHLDEAAAAASPLGGLAASGWHSCAIGMRLYYEGFVRHVASMGAPGIDEVRWVRPVRPGDRLSLRIKIVDKRNSASRPDRGFVSVALDLRNGSDETVMTQRFSMMVQRRSAVPAVAVAPAARRVPAEPQTESLGAADAILAASYDDLPIGHEVALGAQLFTPDAITGFAAAYDPQYFHLDAERARQSHFGGLIASGWQTAAFWMKHYIAARQRSTVLRESLGLRSLPSGPSPGISDLKWIKPAYAGETIAYACKVAGKRLMPGHGGWGLVLTENTGRTSDGTLVFSFNGQLMWRLTP